MAPRRRERPSLRHALAVACILVSLELHISDAFCIPRYGITIVPERRTTVLLWAAKKGKKTSKRGPAPAKGNKKGNFGKRGKVEKRGKAEESSKQRSNPMASSSQSSSSSSSQGASSNKKSSPPWQVLSQKDAKKNVLKEERRREAIKLGQPAEDFEEEEEADEPQVLSKDFLSEPDKRLLNWKRFNPDKAPCGMRFVGASLGRQLPLRLGVPEVAFLGRSNVGKSSLLNKLSVSARASSSDQARVGKTPGATASVNLYALEGAKEKEILGWVDLPGFGYAKLSKETKESVQQAAENYLGNRQELMLGILLVDIRRTPSEDDRAVLAALFDMGVPIVVVATKVDKMSANARRASLETIRDGLGLPDGQPLSVSSVTGEGTKDLWKIILEACEAGVVEFKSKYDKDAALERAEERLEEQEEQAAAFEDGEDISYDQGFDWIHADSGVLYEGDAGDFQEGGEDEEGDEGDYEQEWEDGDFGEDDPEELIAPQRETLKSLRRRAKEMEERGEV